jgi:hypothetical protein
MPGDKTIKTPPCFIQGLNTNVVNVDYSGQQHLFGIRLQPHMLKPLLNVTAPELKNTLVDLTLIKKHFTSLWHQFAEAQSFEERVRICFFLTLLKVLNRWKYWQNALIIQPDKLIEKHIAYSEYRARSLPVTKSSYNLLSLCILVITL